MQRTYCKLVSVRAAGAPGLTVHASTEKLAQATARRCKSAGLLVRGRYFQGKPVATKLRTCCYFLVRATSRPMFWPGLHAISLALEARQRRGRSVVPGCKSLSIETIISAYLSGCACPCLACELWTTACAPGLGEASRSQESCLDHVRHCYGVWQLIPEFGKKVFTVTSFLRLDWPAALDAGRNSTPKLTGSDCNLAR